MYIKYYIYIYIKYFGKNVSINVGFKEFLTTLYFTRYSRLGFWKL